MNFSPPKKHLTDPQFDDLVFNILMLTDEDIFGRPRIVSPNATIDTEIVVIVGIAC